MNSKTTLSTTNARKNLFQITKNVQMPGRYYTFTENGKPKAVLMSAEEFESWQETLEVLQENPGILGDIKQVEKDIKTGEVENYPTLEEVLAEEGFSVAEKSDGSYDIQSKVTAKGKKKPKKISKKI